MPPILPGFYYDAEKKKYFKIQPNHVASNGSARKYSKVALKQEAEELRERTRREWHQGREEKMRLRRSRVLESPLGGGCGLVRELGVGRFDGGVALRGWALQLRREKVLNFGTADAADGTFVFDGATGVLTYAEGLQIPLPSAIDACASVFVLVFSLSLFHPLELSLFPSLCRFDDVFGERGARSGC